MADRGVIVSGLAAFEGAQRTALQGIFDYILKNWRVGLPGHQKAAENMSWRQLNVTTPATANQEFAVAHGIGTAPRVLFPCLDLTTAGTQMVALTNSRAADANYVYLKSVSTSAAITVFCEGR